MDEIPVDEIPVDEIPVDEIPKDESPKDEIPEDESPKDEIPKDEIPKDEIPKDEIPEDEIPEDEVPKDEIPKDEIPEDEVPKDEIPKDEIPEDKIPEDESPKDESAKDESAKDESSNNEPSNDNAPEKETPEDKKQKKESEEKKKKRNKFSWNRKRREEKEKEAEEEKKFPKIRLYNDIVRHVKAYDETPISYDPSLKNDDVWQILHYVSCDYPEFFWLRDDCLTLIAAEDDQEPQIQISFRCKDENGRLDIKQIETKRKEIRQGAKYFTKGITKRTDPYEAFLKIYRRLVLTLEYDHAGAAQEILMQKKDDRFFRTDDRLRSLHSALVSHKVVCSGYAVALQYLMHSIGLPCGTVISELDHSNCGHAFNILKIGKYCYYVDPTWGDTEIEGLSDNIVHYQYCCVPLREFQQTNENELHCHTPNHKMFPQLEELKATTHEYHRYHNYFLARLDRAELIRVIAEQTLRYDPDEMGHFCLSIRFADASLAQRAKTLFESKDGAQLIVEAGKRVKAKNKKKAHLLDARFALVCFEKSAVLELVAR